MNHHADDDDDAGRHVHRRTDLRPWTDDDVEPLIEAYRDPLLRRWTRIPVTNANEARQWLDRQQRGMDTAHRISFAVDETQPDPNDRRLVANVVLKLDALEGGRAEVGFWTTAPGRDEGSLHARSSHSPPGRSTTSAPQALNSSSSYTTCVIRLHAGSPRKPATHWNESCRPPLQPPSKGTCTSASPQTSIHYGTARKRTEAAGDHHSFEQLG